MLGAGSEDHLFARFEPTTQAAVEAGNTCADAGINSAIGQGLYAVNRVCHVGLDGLRLAAHRWLSHVLQRRLCLGDAVIDGDRPICSDAAHFSCSALQSACNGFFGHDLRVLAQHTQADIAHRAAVELNKGLI